MTCTECRREVHRVRVIRGQDYCLSCQPKIALDLSFLKTGNPWNKKETKAYVEYLENRRMTPDKTSWEVYKPRKYIF